VADLVIVCHERDLALSLELAGNLAVQRLLVGLLLLLEELKNGSRVILSCR